jgi:hypothetical protein
VGARPGGATPEEAYLRVINVEVTEVVARPFTETIRLTGAVQAHKDVTHLPRRWGWSGRFSWRRGATGPGGRCHPSGRGPVLAAQVDQARAQASELARESWERRQAPLGGGQVGSELSFLEAKYSAEQAEAA